MGKSEEEYKKELPPEVYHVAREKGTETPFSGEYVDTETKGIYKCAVCGSELFSSDTKFHSGTGWPSFTEAISGRVEFHNDTENGPSSPSLGRVNMSRVEVTCAKCGSHLGHVFDDLPRHGSGKAGGSSLGTGGKGGKRFCINSVCLDLEKKSPT
jgi:peptide-methionine (R)-S-oxide reductase